MGYNWLGNGYYSQFPVEFATQIMHNFSPPLLNDGIECIYIFT